MKKYMSIIAYKSEGSLNDFHLLEMKTVQVCTIKWLKNVTITSSLLFDLSLIKVTHPFRFTIQISTFCHTFGKKCWTMLQTHSNNFTGQIS